MTEDQERAQADSDRAQSDSDRATTQADQSNRTSRWRIVAYVVMGLAAAWGLNIVQNTAQEAHDTAEDFAAAEAREELEEAQESLENCQIRNTAVNNGRERFLKFRDNIAGLFGQSDDPARAEMIQKALFAGINLDPAVEDIDCSKDGKLDSKDYAP